MQPSLFDDGDDDRDDGLSDLDEAHAFVARNAQPTSADAAYATLPRTATARRRVLDHLAAAYPDGDTDERMQAVLDMAPNTECPRRIELWRGGWITDSGERRRTRRGLDAIVWKLSDEARRRLGMPT